MKSLIHRYSRAAGRLTYTNTAIVRYLFQGYMRKALQKDPIKKRRQAIEFVSRVCRKFFDRFNYKMEVHYSKPDLFANNQPYFMVSNHMSYLDIICLSSLEPSVFVTSVEMKNTPFLGDMAGFGGSYFVERRDRSKVPGEVKDLAQLMREGFHVLVFPEATSTNGQYVKPFKRAMFTAAIEAQVPVLPICLRYEEVNGEPFSEANHKQVCWYDQMDFVPHYLNLAKLDSLKATVRYLEPLYPADFEDRHALADKAYEMIEAKYFEGREHLRKEPTKN